MRRWSRSGWPPDRKGCRSDAQVPYSAAAELAAELLLNGLRRTGAREWPGWSRAITETEERGYDRMATALRAVQGGGGAGVALRMLKLLALARDLAA